MFKKWGLSLVVPVILLSGLFVCFPTTHVQAQTPWEDIGFTVATPRPDPDLIVVREKFYGAGGVDLSAYGIGPGPQDYVQSVYFRFFVDSIAGTYDSFIARVEFPAGVTILGIITDGNELGGSIDDGVATETDAIFGVAPNPDDYSEANRGFEQLGGEGTSEFVALANGDNALVFGLNIEEGMDDFRVIIDYGSSFPTDMAFDILSYRIGQLGGAAPDRGIRIGQDKTPIVFGSGDYGEAGSLYNIPLTSTVAPSTGSSLSFMAMDNVYILRDRFGAQPTHVDGFDVDLALPAPDLHTYVSADLNSAVGITDGNDGKLYSFSASFGLAVSTPPLNDTVEMTLPAVAGTGVDLTNGAGANTLYLLRDQASDDTFVDVLDLGTFTYSSHIAITGSDVTEPVAIADIPGSMLFVADADGGFATVNSVTEAVTTGSVSLPSGQWVDATRYGQLVYLLRKIDGGPHTLDVFDPSSLNVTTFGLLDIPFADSAVGLTDGPNGWLYAVAQGTDIPAALTEIDPSVPEVVHQHEFMHFPGSNVSITNLAPTVSAVPGSGGIPSWAHLPTTAAPNPFNPQVTISYRLNQKALVRVAVYNLQGNLVRTLFNGPQSEGEQSATWDGRDRHGRDLPSGTYLYRVIAGAVTGSGKVVLAK